MPCFADAMAASAQERPAVTGIDPTIQSQTELPPANTGTFGIPHLWLILALAVVVVVLAFMPDARRRPFRLSELERMRMRRRPAVDRFLQKKRKSSVDV